MRFTEDRPNPLYRRVCYTLAWSEVMAFALLNTAGLALLSSPGRWMLRQSTTPPTSHRRDDLDARRGRPAPRVKPSTQGEGHERRFFYGSVWAVCIAQPVLWVLWKILPQTRTPDTVKLAVIRPHPGLGRQPRRADCCRARVRSFPGKSSFPTDRGVNSILQIPQRSGKPSRELAARRNRYKRGLFHPDCTAPLDRWIVDSG